MIDKSLTGPSTVNGFTDIHIRDQLKITVEFAEIKNQERISLSGLYRDAIAMIWKCGIYTYGIKNEKVFLDKKNICTQLKKIYDACDRRVLSPGDTHYFYRLLGRLRYRFKGTGRCNSLPRYISPECILKLKQMSRKYGEKP